MHKILLMSLLLLAGCGDGGPSGVTGSKEKPNLAAQFFSGPLTPEGKFYDELQKAESGSAKDQLGLAKRYYSGDGTTKDLAKAAQWFEKAAEQGSEFAQYKIGVMYDQGEGVSKDPAKAIYWWQKAAAQGNSTAQESLAAHANQGSGIAPQ